VLIHVLDVSGFEGRDPLKDFDLIQQELEIYSPGLSRKPQIIAANKMDLPSSEENLSRLREKLEDRFPIMALSAATGQGCRELMLEAGKLLKEQEHVLAAVQPDEVKITRLEADDEPTLSAVKEDEAWILTGSEIRRQITRTNFANEAAVNRLLKILRSMDVDGVLRKAGAADGDTVIIGPMEFEYADT